MTAPRLVLVSLLALSGLAAGRAAPSSLLNKSPFAPPAPPAAPSAAPAGRFELRGVVNLGGELRFSILDTSNSKNYWLKLNESEEGVRISGYDANRDVATVEADGQKQEAAMKAPMIAAMAAAPVPVPVVNGPAPAVQPAGVAQPPSDQEIAERRQRIVEELRRRRALRSGNQAPAP